MATDELPAFQARQEQQEEPLIAAVLAWIASLRAAVTVDMVADAIGSGSTVRILDAVSHVKQLVLNLLPTGLAEGTHTVDQLPGARKLRLSFDVYDPRFHIAVDEQGANAIREIDHETREAIRRIISDAYRNGWHPRVFAPMIQQTIGLTKRQTIAVANLYNTQVENGFPQGRARQAADRYADRLRRQRALTIARTETITAARISRVAGFEQAARHGLFNRSRAFLEWDAIQTDPKEICFQLDGTRVPLGSDFDGLLPPAHPNCRCTVNLVIE